MNKPHRVDVMPPHIYALIDYNAQMLYRRRALERVTDYSIEGLKAQNIMREVCATMGVTIDQIKGRRRLREYVEARHVFCYLCREHTILPLQKIGAMINRDHATVMHSHKTIKGWIEFDQFFKELIVNLTTKIK